MDQTARQNVETTRLDLAERVYQERVRLFFGHAIGNVGGFLTGTIAVSAILLIYGIDPYLFAAWLSTTVLVILRLVLFERQYAKADITPKTSCSWVRRRMRHGLWNGIMFGVTPFLLPPGVGPVPDLFLFIVMTTLMTVVTIAFAGMPKYIYLINATTMGPLTIHLFMTYDTLHMLLGTSAIAWQLLVLQKGRSVSRSTIEAITLNERLRDEIEEHQLAKEYIHHMANHDLLTGAANRRLFEEVAQQAIKRAIRNSDRIGFVMIDLDGFKPINDTFGHHAGDAVLKELVKKLRGAVRDSDLVVRLGGDEFCVMLEQVGDYSPLAMFISKIETAINQPIIYGSEEVPVSASVGLGLFPDDGDCLDSVTRFADKKMYDAKRAKKGGLPHVRLIASG